MMNSKFARYLLVTSMFACSSVTLSHSMMGTIVSGLYSYAARPAINLVGSYFVEQATQTFINHSLGQVRSYSQTAYDAFVEKCQQRSNASSARLDSHVKELLQAFYLVDEEGNVSSLVKEVVLTSLMTGSVPCDCCCISKSCFRATPTFFKIGTVIVEKSVIEYIRKSLEKVQNHKPSAKAAKCFLGQCDTNPDSVPPVDKKSERTYLNLFGAYNLVDEKGKIPNVVKEVVNGLIDEVEVKRNSVGGVKPSEQKVPLLSVRQALRLGKIQRVDSFRNESKAAEEQVSESSSDGSSEEISGDEAKEPEVSNDEVGEALQNSPEQVSQENAEQPAQEEEPLTQE